MWPQFSILEVLYCGGWCVAVCACPQHKQGPISREILDSPSTSSPAPQRLPSLHNLLEGVTQMAFNGLPWSPGTSTLWTTYPTLLPMGFPFPVTCWLPRMGHRGATGFLLSIRAQSTHGHATLPYLQTLQAMIPPRLPFLFSCTCSAC